MTVKDINEIIKIVCPNDEDYEKPCISPKYLRQELEQLALEQEQMMLEPTTKKDCNTCTHSNEIDGSNCYECVKDMRNNYEPTIKNDLALIHTEGLDEEIRCAMCTNVMKRDSGCDGSCVVNKNMYKAVMDAIEKRIQPITKNDLGVREFEEIVVEYPPEDLCTYPEYKGKPYFSIKYKEGKDYFVGYGTYNPKVFSRYLRDYFMPLVTPQEPKTGHWIKVHPLQENDEGDYMCSECKCGGLVWKPTTYCPNCGTKMEKRIEEVEE